VTVVEKDETNCRKEANPPVGSNESGIISHNTQPLLASNEDEKRMTTKSKVRDEKWKSNSTSCKQRNLVAMPTSQTGWLLCWMSE
jgi:hypothetical protein